MDPKPTSNRSWLTMGLAFVVGWTVYLYFFGPRGRCVLPGRGSQTANYEWKLQDLDGKPVPFDSFRGKAVFLNIWATWCGPCVREMPSIARLSSNPRLKDVAFVCVSVDDSPDPVRQFVDQHKLPMTVLWSNGNVPDVYSGEGAIPATFLIAPDGRIVQTEVGSTDWDNPAAIETLESLAKSAPARPEEPAQPAGEPSPVKGERQ
jgi:thiol-disulfide isomerase/thioredoxin